MPPPWTLPTHRPLASLPDLDLTGNEVTSGKRPHLPPKSAVNVARATAMAATAASAANVLRARAPTPTLTLHRRHNAVAAPSSRGGQDEAPRRSYFAAPAAEAPAPVAVAAAEQAPAPVAAPVEAPVAAQPVAQPAPVVAAPRWQSPRVAAPEAAPAGMPRVQPFTLPVEALQAVAAASGLQWVNSDSEKIAAVQAAIAAEPKPVHVPRERPPVVVLDEGPLVLVETRRDLAAMTLPFEQTPSA